MIPGLTGSPRELAALLLTIDQIDPSAGRFTADEESTTNCYRVRNQAIMQALAVADRIGLTAGIALDPAEPDWPVAYIDLPTGQVSWHLPAYPGVWDGHDGATKTERIKAYETHARQSAGWVTGMTEPDRGAVGAEPKATPQIDFESAPTPTPSGRDPQTAAANVAVAPTITDEMVKAYRRGRTAGLPLGESDWACTVRGLREAAPLIAAQALREAAKSPDMAVCLTVCVQELHELADELERGSGG